jgi:hypothetical protein
MEMVPEIMMDEISKAVNKLKDRKAPGVDNITAKKRSKRR